MFHCGLFPSARHILRIRLAPEEGSHALIRSVADQRFQTQSNGVCVGGSTTRCLGLGEERLIDMQCLLHMYNFAI